MPTFDRKKLDPMSHGDPPPSERSSTDAVLGTFFPNPRNQRGNPAHTQNLDRTSKPAVSPSESPICLPDAINPLRIGPLTFADRWDSVLTTLGGSTVTGIGAWISVQTALALDPLHFAAGAAVTAIGLYFIRNQVDSGDLSWQRTQKSESTKSRS